MTPRIPLRHAAIAALLLHLTAATVLAAPKGARLAEYAPAGTNIYVEVTSLSDFKKAAAESPLLANLLTSTDVAELADVLKLGKLSFTDTPLGGIFTFDTEELGRYISGAAALWNSHSGPMTEVAPEMGEAAESLSHFDAVLVFEHDGTKKDEIMEMFRRSIEKEAQDADRGREKIGGTTVHTYRVKDVGEVPEFRLKENVPEDAPIEERIEIVMTTVEAQNVFEFAVLDKVAIFGEGSNRPVTTALTALEKKKESLGRKPEFRAMIEAFQGNDGTADGLIVYVDFEYLHRAAERDMEPEEIAARASGGLRDFRFAGGRLNLEGDSPTIDAYLGVGDQKTGLAGLLDLVKPVSRDLFDNIADDVDAAAAASCDFGQLVRELLRMSSQGGGAGGDFEGFLRQQSQAYLGVNLLDDFVYQLGDQNYSFGYDAATEADQRSRLPNVLDQVLSDQLLALSLRDGALVAQTLGRVVEKLVELAGRPVASSQRFEGVDLHVVVNLDTEAPVLAFAATDKFLYLSSRPELVKQAIKAAGGTGKPIGKDREFRKAMRSVPPDSFVISYIKKLVLDKEEITMIAQVVFETGRNFGFVTEEQYNKGREIAQKVTFAKDPITLDYGFTVYGRRGPEFVHARLLWQPRRPE